VFFILVPGYFDISLFTVQYLSAQCSYTRHSHAHGTPKAPHRKNSISLEL